MKTIPLSVLAAGLLFLSAASRAAECPSLAGKYSISAEPFQGIEVGNYGTSTIRFKKETATSCVYELRSKVSVYADPLESGVQTLTVKKKSVNGGYSVSLSPSEFGPAKGDLYIGQRITLAIELSGCGGEGGASSSCGEYIYFN